MKNGVSVEWVGLVKYDFTNKDTGKKVCGETRWVLVSKWKDGECIHAKLYKARSEAGRVGDHGAMCLFDEYGRFTGVSG